ncbi:MAG TPA: LptF/LptG family permease, partial [Gemmataceae bacterium]|nr:LptF/LptG family permease [Gemmataceae bacterium]
FDQLCEPIVLLAAMFTMAWMQRCNEQFPLLSAGVSTRRIVLPVLVCSAVMLSLAMVNQEFIIPQVADRLTYEKDDPGGDKDLGIQGKCYEPNGIHINGERGNRRNRTVTNFECVIPDSVAGNMLVIKAPEAVYVPGQGAAFASGKGGWLLTNAQPANVEAIGGGNVLEVIDSSGRYFLHTREVDFDALTRNANWYLLASTWRLYEELESPESGRQAGMAVLFHTRMTRPILGLVLVVMGLGVILRDQNRNVIISAGLCLVLCAVYFATLYACKMLGDNEVLPPALAAWAPVLVYGPFGLALFDAVHT